MERVVRFTVNGEPKVVAVKPNATLLNVLREKLGLTGTKKGCEEGLCGACTVLVNGEPASSCLMLAVEADGREITTIEGVAKNGRLHPVQKAFVYEGAIQCGYCTPGFIMSAVALLDRNPDPTEQEIKHAFGGNICRCTGYASILQAIKRYKDYAQDNIPDHKEENKFAVISRSLPRKDAWEKVTGEAKYTDDIQLPNMLIGKILHSPVPHAVILSINIERALKLPGVKAVITGKDVPDILYGVSPARYDEYILAKDKVRYIGDEVAAVAAINEETALEALDLIELDYEELPAVFDPFEAMKEGAPQLHANKPKNINNEIHHHFGDVQKAFQQADYVREDIFTGQRTYQNPMEPHASIAMWDHDGSLIVWSSTQVPHYVEHQLNRILGIPKGKIRVIKPYIGGGFGGKAEATPLDFCSAILAKITGRPVKMVYDRKEMYLHGRGRHQQFITLKTGVKKDGTVTAVHAKIVMDGGAYTSFGIVASYYAGAMLPTLYKLPNFKYDGYHIYTNLPACGAMRGHGCPQPRFAFESQLDMIAEELGIDPFDIRLRNAMEPNQMTINEFKINSCEFKQCLEKVRKASDWLSKRGKLPYGRGIGVGCGGFVSGAGYPIYRSNFPHSNAIIKVSEDGTTAMLFIGVADIGQGCDTVIAQIAAEELGLKYEDIQLVTGDTAITPIDLGSYSSRVTLMAGNAVKAAAAEIKAQIFKIALEKLCHTSEELDAKDRKIFVKSMPEKSITFQEVASETFNRFGPIIGRGSYTPPKLGGTHKGATVGTSPAYSFCAAVAEVEVDVETGKIKVVNLIDAHDCGTPINPMAVHGQVEGAVVMGIGEGLYEKVVIKDGVILNPDLNDYMLPTIWEAPDKIISLIAESYEPAGPYGAKEVGEGALLPVMGAIANAIYDATGVRIKELPITAEKLLQGLKEIRRKKPQSVASEIKRS